jgi:hypothetical protein
MRALQYYSISRLDKTEASVILRSLMLHMKASGDPPNEHADPYGSRNRRVTVYARYGKAFPFCLGTGCAYSAGL